MQRSALMTRVTAYLLQTFNDSKCKGVKPSPPVASKSADVARRTAERLSLTHLGVIAFSITSDPEILGTMTTSLTFFFVRVSCPPSSIRCPDVYPVETATG